MSVNILTKQSLWMKALDMLVYIIEHEIPVRAEIRSKGCTMSPYSDKIGVKQKLAFYVGKAASLKADSIVMSMQSLEGEDRGFLALNYTDIRNITITQQGDRTTLHFDDFFIFT